MVPKEATRFAVNLQRGVDAEHADVHLHFSANFGESPLVVRNSRLRGSWGLEDRLDGPFPFTALRPFLLVYTAFVDSFEVEVNGLSHYSLKVRDGLPISSVTHLAIEAGLVVRAIHIPVESMPRQLRLSTGGGARVGDMIFLKGQPAPEAKSFVVNWQTGPGKFDDILFHLKALVDEGRIVRNNRIDDEWGKEEESKDSPFSPDKPFSLTIGLSSLGFETRLDENEWCRFDHRRQDLSSASTLFLEGELQPTDITIDTVQAIPSTINGTKIKSRGVRVQNFCPEVPFTSRITGGFEKGCILIISGKTIAQPNVKYEVRLQCGDGADSDIALKYEAFWKDGTPRITLNSKEEDTWGSEIKGKVDEGEGPGRFFELLIARVEEGFRCFYNGEEVAELPYRLDDGMPDYVTLSGDLLVRRVIVL